MKWTVSGKISVKLYYRKRIIVSLNYNKNELVSVIVYADFECLVKPRKDGQHDRIVSNHEAFSIGFYVKYTYDFENVKSEYKSYRQRNENAKTPAAWFIENMVSIVKKMEEIYKNVKEMNSTKKETCNFLSATCCHICKMKFTNKDKKVRDHCHLTGL